MKKKNRIISFMMIIVFLSVFINLPVNALDWDGDSSGGGGTGVDTNIKGFSIRFVDIRNMLGYRFSCIDRTGNLRSSKIIDIYRNTSHAPYADEAYKKYYRFSNKYNKKQLISNQNGRFTTEKTNINCYKEKNLGFASELPDPDKMYIWQSNDLNINIILKELGIGNINNLNSGDKVLVEPIYDVRLEGDYHALTVTETAVYGKHLLGADSDGGISYTAEKWGFISRYVNQHYPNSLYTPDGQGLWESASPSTERIKFKYIINKGYGVGIAYTNDKDEFSPTLSVNECRAYKGTLPTKTYQYGTSIGNVFANWKYVSGYPVSGDTVFFSVNFPKEDENTYVKQTVWIDGTQVGTRKGYSDDLEWYDVKPTSATVTSSKAYYTVKARVDWIDSSGKTKIEGAEKTFYIPVKPIITREKVSAYNEENKVQAYSGKDGSSGKLYFGQKVTFGYNYGAETTWDSYNNVEAVSYRWNGSSWAHIYNSSTGSQDVLQNKVVISKSKPYSKSGSIGSYVIPLPAKSDTNSYRLKFDMTTAWSSDAAHTKESSTYYIPIVKSDVAIVDMKLVDKNGNYVDRSNLTPGEVLTVHYVYKNNSDCTVYVKGYNDNGSQISGVYAIPAGKSIEVAGASHTVPNKQSYTIWGGVYLSTVSKGNTDYESNGNNNASNFTCKTKAAIRITAIEPNAAYRENTEVISSYYVWNDSTGDILPSHNVTVKLRIYKPGSTSPYLTLSKAVVIPKGDKNIVYFKWKVPEKLNGKDMTLKADVIISGTSFANISNSRSTVSYVNSVTPDTRYEESAPKGFIGPATPSETTGSASWSEYIYSGGKFVKKDYKVTILKSTTNTITPATGKTAEKVNGQWVMKSGYGFSLKSQVYMQTVNGSNTADESAYTIPQYAYVLYPEYYYKQNNNEYTTLELINNTSSKYFALPNNIEYGRVHFIPLWYPNGKYSVKVVQSDCWTPVGMITKAIVPNTFKIDGNAYDDWYERG